MCSMAVQHTLTVVYVENIAEIAELLYVVGIYIVACTKIYGLILNRDKITNIMDGLNG